MRPIENLPEPPRGPAGPGGLYLRPLDLAHGAAPAPGPADRLLGGGPARFRRVEAVLRSPERIVAFSGPVDDLRDWALAAGRLEAFDAAMLALTRRRRPLFGKPWSRPLVMGVVNATPDSFSDGTGRFSAGAAVSRAHALIEAGADIIDIGGESTRPGARPVGRAEEIDRAVPVVEAAAGFGVPVSIDTSKAAVMRAALAAGASMVNDTTALAGDPESLGAVARAGVPVVLMHMRGAPRTMQDDPRYDCAPLDAADFLAGRIAACARAGVSADRLVVDPGIGFGKTAAHNAAILARIGLLHGLGVPVALGASRKSFVAEASRGEAAADRLAGSLALALGAAGQGVQVLRVHDAAETLQALALRRAVLDAL